MTEDEMREAIAEGVPEKMVRMAQSRGWSFAKLLRARRLVTEGEDVSKYYTVREGDEEDVG